MQNGQRDACRLPLLWGHAWRFPFEAGVLKFLSNHLLFLKRVGRKWRGRERSGQEGTPREGKITISIMTARLAGKEMGESCTIAEGYFQHRPKSRISLSGAQIGTRRPLGTRGVGGSRAGVSVTQCGRSRAPRGTTAPQRWASSNPCLTGVINSTSHSICEKSLKKIRTVRLCKLSR